MAQAAAVAPQVAGSPIKKKPLVPMNGVPDMHLKAKPQPQG